MNAMRRKRLYETRARLKDIEEGLLTLYDDLEQIRDEEQEALDNLHESLQESSKGEILQEAIDKMDEILEALDDIDLDTLADDIEEVACI